uniref:Uncharacterized protein n=1 Tax=Moniliophthora roreri TaxID=221103 RepID=A0A0W0FYL6_MONRR
MSRNDDFFAYNFAFGLEVKQRFPTFHSAIGALHQIRKPSEACVDSDHVNTALLALAAIGRATARPTTHSKNVILIKQNWNSMSLVIPKLFLYPDESRDTATKHMEITALLEMAPYLVRSATIIWAKTISELHWTWGRWTGLLGIIFGVNKGSLFAHEVFTRPDELKAITGNVIRLVYALNRCFQANTKPDGKTLYEFAALLRLLMYLVSCRRNSPLPLNPLFITPGGVKAIVTLHGTLISQQQQIFIGEILPNLLSIFLLDGVPGITDALESGLLISIFKTGKPYVPNLPQFQSHKAFPGMVRQSQYVIVETISLYLVYPPPDVLRRSLKSMRRIIDGGLEEKLKDVRDLFWQCWQQCKEKAVLLEMLKDGMRNPVGLGALILSSSLVSFEGGRALQGSQEFPLLSTLLQLSEFLCRDRTLALKAGKPCVSSRDRASFFSWVALYIREHGRSILKALAGFARPPQEPATVGGQEDYMMISQESQEYASRRGVVVLNFCDRENLNILSLECLKICHIDDAVEDPRLRSDPDFVKSLRSRHLSLDETEMQVLAFFPDTTRGGDCAFPLQEVCRLPQLVEDMDSEGDSLGKDLEGDL